jgi:hypothetical protein
MKREKSVKAMIKLESMESFVGKNKDINNRREIGSIRIEKYNHE